MLLINNVILPLETDFSNTKMLLAKSLKIKVKDIKTAKLFRKSVDARHKANIVFCCSFLAEFNITESSVLEKNKNAQSYVNKEYVWQKANAQKRPVIVGFGPAGMFAALALARAGLKPIIIERGRKAEERKKDVENFFSGLPLNPESNVQFGEGGAGTFSDGKLNTGIKDSRCRTVLQEFVRFGAPNKILYEAKPHIGTDILINIVKNIRNEIENLGGEIHFNTKLEKIIFKNGSVSGIEAAGGKSFECSYLILAIGHSARDTFEMLSQSGIFLSPKPFSVGARIEHLQKDIDEALYGDFAGNKALGAADYKMAVHLKNGRGVYTFCMCPGGEVVNASSEADGIAVNGMSRSARDFDNANSALLVEVKPEDLGGSDVFAGIRFQREIEKKAFAAAGGAVPFCFVGDLFGKFEPDYSVKPTVKPRCVRTDIYNVLPEFVADSIKLALPEFGKKIKGFDSKNAVLTFPETRSTSPVRIDRGESFESVSAGGIFPAGEGAGYAGGIMSAAVDGLKTAEAVIKHLG